MHCFRYQIQRSTINIQNLPSQDTIISTNTTTNTIIKTTIKDINIKPNNDIYYGLSDTLFKLYHQYGLKGLYRGGLIRMLFYTPSTGITMAIYEEIKKILIRNKYY